MIRALLWFLCGPGLSLIIAAVVGMAGALLLAGLAVLGGAPMLALIVCFMGLQCLGALRAGRGMMKLERSPRREGVRCPVCGTPPPMGAFWNCPCGNQLDPFECGGRCPGCGRAFEMTACAACGQLQPMGLWYVHGAPERVGPSISTSPFPSPPWPPATAGR
jgi:hypothetical protein